MKNRFFRLFMIFMLLTAFGLIGCAGEENNDLNTSEENNDLNTSEENNDFNTLREACGSGDLIETNNAGNAFSPQIAVDSDGNAVAVWSQSDGIRYNIWANHYEVGTGWSTAELIETEDVGNAYYPQVVMDSSSNAIVVWHQWDGARYNIWTNRYDVGIGWSVAELIETNDEGDAYAPQIAMDSSDNAVVVWYQWNGQVNNIWANWYEYGRGWNTAELIETDNTSNAEDPQVAVDINGNAIVVWSQSDGIHYNIWSNRYEEGTGWGTAELVVVNTNGDAHAPQVAVDVNGNAVAVWYQWDATRYSIWSNRYEMGWGTAELIETDDTGNAIDPQVAVDIDGNAMVVWHQMDGVVSNIWYNRYEVGIGWGTAGLIESSNEVDAFDPQIAIDYNGNAVVVWSQSDNLTSNIWTSSYTVGIGWGTSKSIKDTNGCNAYDPKIAIDSFGNTIAVWYQLDDMASNIGSTFVSI